MASSSTGGPPANAKHLFFQVIVNKKLLSLLEPYKKMNFITTYAEVLDGLRIYILKKQLYDPAIPTNINCSGDALSSVLGVEKFTVYEVRKILLKFVYPVSRKNNSAGTIALNAVRANEPSWQNEAFSSKPSTSSVNNSDTDDYVGSSSSSSQKRKANDFVEGRKRRTLKKSCDQAPVQPMYLYIPSSPSKDLNSSDTAESIQGYETSFVKDTSDESVYTSEENSDNVKVEDVVTVEETFDVEYELASDSDQDTEICITESDTETELNTFTIIYKSDDSDESFWADKSSDEEYTSDAEIKESEKWTCKKCNSLNNPTMGYCIKCWGMRSGWIVPKREERRIPRRRKPRRRKMSGVSKEEDSSCNDKPCTSSTSNSAAESMPNTLSDNIDSLEKQPENTDSLPCFPIISYELDSSQENSNSSSNSSQDSLSSDFPSNYFSKSSCSSSELSSQELSTLSSNSSEEFRSSSSQEFFSSSSSTKSQRDVIQSLKHFSTLNLSNVPKIDSETKLCLLCCLKPANASIIHGKFAHQISCFKCARKLQQEHKKCPVCRKKIERVVHQFTIG